MEKKLAVVALGGNALLRGNQKGTIEEQNANTVDTLENLIYLIKEGYNLIISHGNGPQVGNILMSDDAGTCYRLFLVSRYLPEKFPAGWTASVRKARTRLL
mgnify:CR=1 FL=1